MKKHMRKSAKRIRHRTRKAKQTTDSLDSMNPQITANKGW